MHVRVAPSHGGTRLSGHRPPRIPRHRSALLFALTACWIGAGCQRAAVPAPALTFEWTLTPAASTSGPSVLALRVADAAGQPVRGAHLRVEAQMSHPGMAPIIAPLTETSDGRYHATVQLTMSGDWILLITGTLATGEAVDHQIDVRDVHAG